ncbi:serine protease [Metabacillus sp. KIGAM252]|uniref:Serine protease n=2 Tax=Metabacillus flavus TaxID=2823519 RepID=A0ABS5LAJ4_9BACI|nr:S1C family serine protease [Metabacillus flavus]MBS2967656.1 serine protease [Metabacillus flavus]
MERSKYCPHCGHSLKGKPYKLLTLLILSMCICAGVFTALYMELTNRETAAKELKVSNAPTENVKNNDVKPTSIKNTEAPPVKKETPKPAKELSQIIDDAQPKVFTILSEYSQGSGFLINNKGDVLTNAHVAEGALYLTIRDNEGKDHNGTVIGYSNEIDIAIIRVDSLAGRTPLELEETNESKLGDEVIALGSPQGFENTATTGNISGVNRTFYIEPHTYEGIYQISAPIAPGSSGGPLLDGKTERVIAINSARHGEEATIGFSIPLFKVMSIIHDWVSNPMTEEEITSLFYTDEGTYFYQDLYDDSEFYFDGGDYTEEYDDYTAEEDDSYEDPYYEEEETYDDREAYPEVDTEVPPSSGEYEDPYTEEVPEDVYTEIPEEDLEEDEDMYTDPLTQDEDFEEETIEEDEALIETP